MGNRKWNGKQKIKWKNWLLSVMLLAFLSAQVFLGLTVSAETNDVTEKIDAELQEIMAGTPEGEMIPVFVWLKDTSREEIEAQAIAAQNEIVEASIAELSLPAKEKLPIAAQWEALGENFDIEIEQDTLHEIVDAYISAERSASVEAYTEANNAWLAEAFPETKTVLFHTVELEQPEVTFVSAYSPTVSINLTAKQIEELCESEAVEMLYYEHQPEEYDPFEAEQTAIEMPDASTNALEDSVGYKSDISYMTKTEGLLGTGVKIGLYDSKLPRLTESRDSSWSM